MPNLPENPEASFPQAANPEQHEAPTVNSPEAGKVPRTAAQAEAARRNGAKSRGPVTPMGKAISARNGITHGLTAAQLLLPDESADELDLLRDSLLDQFQPANPAEEIIVQQMVTAQWLWRRATAQSTDLVVLERERTRALFDKAFSAGTPDRFRNVFARESLQNQTTLAEIERHQTRYFNQFHRAIRALQNLRKAAPDHPAENTNQKTEPGDLIENKQTLPGSSAAPGRPAPLPDPHEPAPGEPVTAEIEQAAPETENPDTKNTDETAENVIPIDQFSHENALPEAPAPPSNEAEPQTFQDILIAELRSHLECRPLVLNILRRLTKWEDKAA